MEKISLLLLLVKKTLIGTVIAGILGFGSISEFFSERPNDNKGKKIEKRIHNVPGRYKVPGQ